jgi:hypothetical protein
VWPWSAVVQVNPVEPMEEPKSAPGSRPYCLSEALKRPLSRGPRPRFPIVSFNHVSREVLDLDIAREFYLTVLGFIEIPRPAFEVEGVWLYGFGLSLHLIKSRYPKQRELLRGRRLGEYVLALYTPTRTSQYVDINSPL